MIKILKLPEIAPAIISIQKELNVDKSFILVDENTKEYCLPKIDISLIGVCHIIVVPTGEDNKSLPVLTHIWDELIDMGATRHSLLINIGGGMVTDMGGFAATTFKRGMHFVNIPTSILASIDASTGGKTGINYKGLKNEIGAFSHSSAVLISLDFFDTLPSSEILSGYAEMVKHSLLADKVLFSQTISYDIAEFDTKRLGQLIEQNIVVKTHIVDSDCYEMGRRKALNFGHTIGHAIEMFSYRRNKPIAHGYAVMWGMIGELYLSCFKFKLDKEVLNSVLQFAKSYYGTFPFTCDDYNEIIDIMKHDKKNSHDAINFTLLTGIGDMRINQIVEINQIMEALDFIREN